MLNLSTEEITCPNCATKIDVPVYRHDGTVKYGMKFCHQCGASLFIESNNFDFISKDFLYWLSNNLYQSFCDKQECDSCPFSLNKNEFGVKCTELNDERILQIFKQKYDKE